MSLVGFLILLLVAAVVGVIAQALAGFSRGGLLAAIGVGFIGAYIGTWLAAQFGLPPIFTITIDGQPFPVVWAIIGGALFAALLSLLFGGYYRRRVVRR
jgi:uncharacterized membrane protein YeaQ/YmgE (transglycosylase-associated protein family)